MRINRWFVLLALLISACSTQPKLPPQTAVALQTCQWENRTYTLGAEIGGIPIICGFDLRYSTVYPQWMPADYLYPTQLP